MLSHRASIGEQEIWENIVEIMVIALKIARSLWLMDFLSRGNRKAISKVSFWRISARIAGRRRERPWSRKFVRWRWRKWSVSPDSALRLRDATARTLGSPQRWRRFEVGKSCTVGLTVMNSGQADVAANIPGTVRESGRTLSFRAADAVEGYRWFRSALALAGTLPR